MIKILKDFKACDPELWGRTDMYAPDVLNGVDNFLDAAAFHMEAVAFYAMITHMFAGNDDTNEKANLKANYPIAYLIAKFTDSRSIDVAALRDAVKSRLKVADLPSFCQRMDYFHAIAYFLTTTENDDGVVYLLSRRRRRCPLNPDPVSPRLPPQLRSQDGEQVPTSRSDILCLQ